MGRLIKIQDQVKISFLCTALQLFTICLPLKFQFNHLFHSLQVMLHTNIFQKMKARETNQEIKSRQELCFLGSAFLFVAIYHNFKSHINLLHSFKVMLCTKKFQRGEISKVGPNIVKVLVKCTSSHCKKGILKSVIQLATKICSGQCNWTLRWVQ